MIRTTIRGVRFEGSDMDELGALDAPDGQPPEAAFTFHHGALWSCAPEWVMALPVEQDGGAWSDYSPAGAPLTGGLACFRDAKDRYRQVDGKHGPHGILAIRDKLTEFVPETWLCERFEHRGPGAGHRGSFPLQFPL